MERTKKNIAILGSTGSIGKQALEVISEQPDHFGVEVLTSNNNSKLLVKQAKQFKPNAVVIVNEAEYDFVNSELSSDGIKVYSGSNSLASIVEMDSIDMVLTALVGYSGLLPTAKAIKAGKEIALANKETLVVAGEWITGLAKEEGVNIYPVDSEHSAIFQCMVGEFHNPIEKIILTASGGPFRGKDRDYLKSITKEQALKHPNWDMGAKITIDSASLMNKGLEVIEAKWLFGVETSNVEVVIHPQSIIHSMVQFKDGSIKAQMGLPDMKLPILYAMSYPNRIESNFKRFNFADYPSLTFEKPDLKTFRNLDLAYKSINFGGNMPCILNAANEVAVESFLKDELGFLEMSDVVETCMEKVPFIPKPQYEDFVNTDKEARTKAREIIK